MEPIQPRSDLLTTRDSRGTTVFQPRRRPDRASPPSSWSLPPDLQREATGRLRLTAITYSTVFFLADLFPLLVAARSDLAYRFQSPSRWLPMVLPILAGIVVTSLVSIKRLSWETKVNLGLIFQVLGSYGIAIAMYGSAGAEELLYTQSPSW